MSKEKASENKDKKEETTEKGEMAFLEEDDEFEEFPAEDWQEADEDHEDANIWVETWDDDDIEDDFNQQLKAELEKATKASSGPKPMQM